LKKRRCVDTGTKSSSPIPTTLTSLTRHGV